MTISLDTETRKKLILGRQLFQRAVLQAENQHSYVDSLMAVITFDLANETILKAVVSAMNTSITPDSDFQKLFTQAEKELNNNNLPDVSDKSKIHSIRKIRNAAQHNVRYPTRIEVSDCRTYTRDFLKQTVFNVWNEDFDSISLVDAIQNTEVKNHLLSAETNLKNNDFINSVIESKVALTKVIKSVEASIVGKVPSDAENIIVKSNGFSEDKYVSNNLYLAFMSLRDLVLIRTIGLELQSYLRYKKLTENIGLIFFDDGGWSSNISDDNEFNFEQANYVINFVTNTVLQIENLVGDINKPFDN